MQIRKDKEIVAVLDISPSTVRTHIGESKSRLAADDRVDMAYRIFWAFRYLIEPHR